VEREERPQNIYDDPRFFAGYSRMERFGSGWVLAVEHADFLSLLPEVDGRRVLDLGCGAGQLALHLANQGAAEIIGVDVSQTMLDLARNERSHARVKYVLVAIEDVAFPPERFDLVASSLAFHYVADYVGLLRRIARWLVPGGVLVYSTEHPIYTARLPNNGWVLDDHGQRTGWSLDHYADEGPRLEHWFVDGVRKYHRTVAALLNGILDAGLQIERVLEPVPRDERLQRRPEFLDERRRPMFLLVRARRR
jgi:ubiquinone/menaquinone biosynthesis C-methylase UbiE